MSKLFKLGEEFFWTMFWVFVALIAGFALLGFVSNKFNGNIIGTSASWVEHAAQAQ